MLWIILFVPALTYSSTGTGPIPGGKILSFGGGYSDTKSGDYWWYDDQATAHPWDPTGAGYPPLFPLPTLANVPFSPLHDSPNALKFKKADEPVLFVLPDTFLFYGVWYEPGVYLYISPDGWLSFDRKQPAPNPSSTLPYDDNISNLICPYWCDFTPTGTSGWVGPAEPNCVYYYYDEDQRLLIVEWYKVKHGNQYYTFEVDLSFGADKVFILPECGLYYSGNLIQCRYQEVDPAATNGWLTPANFAVGIEDQTESKGLYVDKASLFHTLFGQHALRFIYRKVYRYDMAAFQILSPGKTALRFTPIEPKVVVANVGREIATCAVNFKIDSSSTTVYSQNTNVFNLYPAHNDTITFPCWSEPAGRKPADLGSKYRATLNVSGYAPDECSGNNHLDWWIQVTCDDSLTYEYEPGSAWGTPVNTIMPGTGYPTSGFTGATLISKVSVVLGDDAGPDDQYGNFRLEIWDSENGCNMYPKSRLSGVDQGVVIEGKGMKGMNWVSYDPMVLVKTPGSAGNLWVVMKNLGGGPYDHILQEIHANLPYPFPHSCFADYPGPGFRYPVRSAFSGDGGFNWNSGTTSGPEHFWELAAMAHLRPQVPPMPPCYDDAPHDVATVRVVEPEINYVQAESAYNCISTIANYGYNTEPESGFFYSHLKIDRIDSAITTVYHESTAVSKIGQLGDSTDDPDSLFITYAPAWTPASGGDMGFGVVCTLNFYVKLGSVGPDKTDHCPENDLLQKGVTVLWNHDVGVDQIIKPQEGDIVFRGSTLYVEAEIRNYGFHEEGPFNVELTIRDTKPDTLIFTNIQPITFLDWRGNSSGNPDWIVKTFPGWTVPWQPDHHQYKIEVRTLLTNDRCPANDFKTFLINNDVGISDWGQKRPSTFELSAVRPNPFANVTEIHYSLPVAAPVSLRIYDISGKLVKTLVDWTQASAYYAVRWDGVDNQGHRAGGGIYILRMETPQFRATKKFVLLR
jgi:hypothetical protein